MSSSSSSNKDEFGTSSSKSKSKSPGTGGASMGTSPQTMGSAQPGQNEITGQVIQKKGSTVYVQDQMGAVVPLKTDKSTKFEGIKRDQLKEGDQIRASFDVRHKTENLATSISLESVQKGTGGAGSNLGKKEGAPSEEQGETPAQEQQEQKSKSKSGTMGSGTGGSGDESGTSGQSNQPDQSNY